MALHLHRAERTDLLDDGLGALLSDPMPDPFAEELVLVSARGVGPDGLRAVIAGAGGPLDFAASRLSDVQTMDAMTIHKSQGSQADEVTMLMPNEDSRLLTAPAVNVLR
jgi:hypothetical protein